MRPGLPASKEEEIISGWTVVHKTKQNKGSSVINHLASAFGTVTPNIEISFNYFLRLGVF